MSVSSSKYFSKLILWTSSHGKDHHYLPFWLEKRFKYSSFSKPKIEAISGGRITYSLVHEISCKAIKLSPQPQIHVVIYGDNNLRPNRRDSEEIFDTLQYFRLLISNFSNFPNCHLIIASLIPCPLTDPTSKEKFRHFNEALNQLINTENERGFQRISFLNLTNTFIFQGEIQDEEAMFEPDGIHFTSRGALELTDRLLEHLRIIPIDLNFQKKSKFPAN